MNTQSKQRRRRRRRRELENEINIVKAISRDINMNFGFENVQKFI
jgi:hypothetical protein